MTVKNNILPTDKKDDGPKTLPMLLESPAFKNRFEQVLGKRAPQFMSSILSAVSANQSLKEANPMTIIQSAMKAAALDLPIDGNLGFAYIVPYRNKGKKEAQFQLG
jgi:recombination protein RecT